MIVEDLGLLIKAGDVQRMRGALAREPLLANRPIRWFLNRENESDPLHFVSDCVGHGWLTNGTEGALTEVLHQQGAAVNGSENRESPLIAAASLSAEKVSRALVEAGAALEATSIFGARALHWAAWVGTPATVELLIAHNANIEARCSEFGASPLFWAVHGYSPEGPTPKKDQVGVARILIQAGASVATSNKHGLSALELAKRCGSGDMYELLRRHCA
jgi:ankyrin repeat protein